MFLYRIAQSREECWSKLELREGLQDRGLCQGTPDPGVDTETSCAESGVTARDGRRRWYCLRRALRVPKGASPAPKRVGSRTRVVRRQESEGRVVPATDDTRHR